MLKGNQAWHCLHKVDEDNAERENKHGTVFTRWMKKMLRGKQAWHCLHKVDEDNVERKTSMALSSQGG
ncbi:hypothetical protein M3936_21815 [Sutcliffiella horikoshii]|uniref:hypothetical protein n=1 Tax=Sutcliffiella horikoshii TaxID=79883 RepID=UPI00203FE6F4|nr:hypothetical protein [Sutcliffiella horikoshii]MCM3620198.1 hypothetical protein [Sutcliffiella horikoshii]